MINLQCRVCDNTFGNTDYIVQEMMLGLREQFNYFKCSKCGCLQISEIPSNLSKYYPTDYYSFNVTGRERRFIKLKIWLRNQILRYRLGHKNIFGYILSHYFNFYYWIFKDLCNYNSNILDIGCGTGNLLLDLKEQGFRKLTGIDPFISQDICYDNGVTVYKKTIEEITEKYDLIILHHSFEHMENPKKTLLQIFSCLNSQSYVVIFIPVVSCYAFRKYGINWVQLDAPRHIFLHTPTSMNLLAQETGFKVFRTIYDSTAFQFTGSERYQNDISLFETFKFSKKQLKIFKSEAIKLNRLNDGDSACFYLYKE